MRIRRKWYIEVGGSAWRTISLELIQRRLPTFRFFPRVAQQGSRELGVVSPQAIRSTLDIDVRDEPVQRMLCRVRQGGGLQSEGV